VEKQKKQKPGKFTPSRNSRAASRVAIFTVAFADATWGRAFRGESADRWYGRRFCSGRGYSVETGWYLPSARFHGLYGRCEIAMCDPVSSSLAKNRSGKRSGIVVT